ncbi:MAG: hypothetical protein QME45_13830 [Clostridiales bacterium]|nr:hypothetical protein [Clostridiales bacterium]
MQELVKKHLYVMEKHIIHYKIPGIVVTNRRLLQMIFQHSDSDGIAFSVPAEIIDFVKKFYTAQEYLRGDA